MKKKDIFATRRILVPICKRLTRHKYCRLIGWDAGFVENNFKYANRHDFYYKCKICGEVFFNHHVSKEDLEMIKEKSKNE